MPTSNGIGISEVTEYKQHILRKIIIKHLIVVDAIFKKIPQMPKKYFYVDATAGTGRYSKIDGSPLIFLDVLKQITPCFEPKIYFIEEKKENYEELIQNVNGFNVDIICDKYQNSLPEIIKQNENSFGLVYIDPNGIVDFDCMKIISECKNFKKIDLLFNYNASAYKRKSKAFKIEEDFISLLDKIDKDYWFIRKQKGRWQWSFLFGSNTDKFKLSKGLDFYDIFSEEGKKLLWKLKKKKKEYPHKIPYQKRLC